MSPSSVVGVIALAVNVIASIVVPVSIAGAVVIAVAALLGGE